MTRLLLPASFLLLAAGCYPGTGPLQDVHVDLRKGEWAWCLAPTGQIIGWTNSGEDAMGLTYGTCTQPARFVFVRACQPGEVPPEETPETWAARVRLSGDNSLVGDSVGGRPFCAPAPPS